MVELNPVKSPLAGLLKWFPPIAGINPVRVDSAATGTEWCCVSEATGTCPVNVKSAFGT